MTGTWKTGTPKVDGAYLVTVENPFSGERLIDTVMFIDGEWAVDMYQVIAWQNLPEEYNDEP